MAGLSAFIDACVLYKANVREVMFEGYIADLYRMWLSVDVVDELADVLDARSGVGRGQYLATVIRETFPETFIENYQWAISGLSLPDPDDLHVLAAAIVAGIQVLVTDNVKDFSKELVAPHGIDVQSSDEFLTHLLRLHPNTVLEIVQHMPHTLTKPPMTLQDVVKNFHRHVPAFGQAIGAMLGIGVP